MNYHKVAQTNYVKCDYAIICRFYVSYIHATRSCAMRGGKSYAHVCSSSSWRFQSSNFWLKSRSNCSKPPWRWPSSSMVPHRAFKLFTTPCSVARCLSCPLVPLGSDFFARALRLCIPSSKCCSPWDSYMTMRNISKAGMTGWSYKMGDIRTFVLFWLAW